MEDTPIPTFLLNADNWLKKCENQELSAIHNLKLRREQILKRRDTINSCRSKKESNKELKLRKLKQEINAINIKIEEVQEAKQHLQKQLKNYQRYIEEVTAKSSQVRDDIGRLNTQLCALEQEVASHRLLLKEKQTAFITANGYFKSRLQIYVDIEDPTDNTIVVAFFTSEKQQKYEYFVKLSEKNDKWNLLELKPELSCQQYLTKNLSETNDIQGFMCYVRKLFHEHASKSKVA